MAYVRRKQVKGHDYYYLVESYRQNGKVKTRTLKYLGAHPPEPAPCQAQISARSIRVQGLLWDESPAAS